MRNFTDNPDFLITQSKKHFALDDRLKHVYVTSTDPAVSIAVVACLLHIQKNCNAQPTVPDRHRSNESAKALPHDRRIVEDFEYGFQEPIKVSRGRSTLRQALKFISDHHSEPEIWTVQRIANEYKLKEEVVCKIYELLNAHVFTIFTDTLFSFCSKCFGKLSYIRSFHT